MMSQQLPVQPPGLAVWLLKLVVLPETAESILGDLLEEFSVLAAHSGVAQARKWYWRQTAKALPQLAGVSFRSAPFITVAAVTGGFLLRRLVAPLVSSVTFALLERYPDFFEHHFRAYLFFASTGLDLAHICTFLMIGLVVALVARRNEMAATISLALIFGAMALLGSVFAAVRDGNLVLLWRLAWYFTDSLAVVLAGAMVRTERMAAVDRHTLA